MAYGDNYTSDVFSNYLQKRGASGRFPTARESSAMFAPVLNYNLNMARQAHQMALQQQQIDMQKQAYADQAKAAKVSGITQLIGLPIQGGLAYGVAKQAGLFNGLLGGGANAAAIGASNAMPLLGADAEAVGGGMFSTPAAGMTSVAGPIAAAYGAQLASAPYVQKLANKVDMPHAGRGWKYGGMAGAQVGAAYDIGKKVYDKVSDFVGGLF